jgi:hypothetical protein
VGCLHRQLEPGRWNRAAVFLMSGTANLRRDVQPWREHGNRPRLDLPEPSRSVIPTRTSPTRRNLSGGIPSRSAEHFYCCLEERASFSMPTSRRPVLAERSRSNRSPWWNRARSRRAECRSRSGIPAVRPAWRPDVGRVHRREIRAQ